ncbi:MAG: response regulator [Chloroflexota bacterium]
MKEKVLLVEDDRTMLTLLSTLLRFEGFEVAQLVDDEHLEDAMNTIRREAPAVILLDVHLRRLNGLDLLAAIRADETTARARVVMSSGSDFRERCLAAGADDFVLKPYMPEELIRKIRQASAAQT